MHLTMQVAGRPKKGRRSRQQKQVWILGLCVLVMAADARTQGRPKHHAQFDSNMLLRGVSDDVVDLSRFESPNAVLPGQYRVDILVNGTWRGSSFVEFRDAGPEGVVPCYTAELLRGTGFDMEKLERNAGACPYFCGRGVLKVVIPAPQ